MSIPRRLIELTVDIETKPPELRDDQLKAIAGLKIPRTLKKSDSIKAWIDDFIGHGKHYKSLSLDTLFADIVSIAVKESHGDVVCWVNTPDDDKSPIEYFAETLGALADRSPFILVGHNVIGFDAPILWRHLLSAGYRQLAAIIRPAGKYKSHQYFDTMLQYPGDKYHSLKAIAVAQDWPLVEGFSGADVYQAWLDGRYTEIAEYNCNDVELTWKLYRYLYGD